MEKRRSELLPPLWVVFLITIVFLIWIIFQLRELLALIVIGFSISYAIEPALVALEKRKIGRRAGLFVILLLTSLLLFLMLITALPVLIKDYQLLQQSFPTYLETAKARLLTLLHNLNVYLPLDKFINSPLTELNKITNTLSSHIVSTLQSFLSKGYSIGLAFINALLLPLIVYYISVDFSHLRPGFLKLFPCSRREQLETILTEINFYVSNFVRGQLTICVILFVMYAIVLWFFGIELWLLLAFISGFGHIVPYLGFLTGIILSSIMALVTYTDWYHLIAVWLSYSIVQFLEGSVISPRVLGEKVGLSPLVVILGLLAGGILFGVLGIFLAVPALAILKVLSRYFHGWLIESCEKN